MHRKNKEIEETEEIQIQQDEGGNDVSVAFEGEEEIADSASEVGGLDGGRQTVKKRAKKSCHLKKEEEALVLEWIEVNPLLWNSKDN